MRACGAVFASPLRLRHVKEALADTNMDGFKKESNEGEKTEGK